MQKFPAPAPSTTATQAARAGDATILQALSHDELSSVDASGNTPLIWAADEGAVEAVEVLLKKAPEVVDVRGFLGATALRSFHSYWFRKLLNVNVNFVWMCMYVL